VDSNIFYTVYKNLRIDKGITDFVFVIPGYAKTFKKQLNDFMFRLQKSYADTLSEKMAIITFAWGDQSVSQFYYKAKRSANRAANDFAIFQHMLEDFLSDSAFFANNPNDLDIYLMATSMGNQLLKRYLIKRERQGIELVPVYNKMVFIGSDAGIDSFEEGKGFHNLMQMTDSVTVYVNRRDWPLTMSQYMNMKLRMGRGGISNLDELPPTVQVRDVTNIISWEDLPALGHDYLLRNKKIKSGMVESSIKEEQ
jgi:esterase/lipase superfamily enzyme